MTLVSFETRSLALTSFGTPLRTSAIAVNLILWLRADIVVCAHAEEARRAVSKHNERTALFLGKNTLAAEHKHTCNSRTYSCNSKSSRVPHCLPQNSCNDTAKQNNDTNNCFK